ncbi:MAG: hypothetical protein A2Z06_00365 [Candidatus Glassbacteria bacterium RBG_16_58_8]|uniref:ADP-heptose--LPS heptosyltransferase n=1 Tax=Candidatus Glassbacteria bacterium RBG_16_58_8 TaxID=1817866 RepID=A0A1F5Y9M4_9BACT|nr:MAG: hypothetical protein A2Z06_00365 [Candidatus Glassbacteria bacterium RBG_16_58_8]
MVLGGIGRLRKYLAASKEEAVSGEKAFLDETMRHFVKSCQDRKTFPRELFHSLQLWGDELARLAFQPEALRLYDEAIDLGVRRYPELYLRVLVGKARVFNSLGRFREARALMISLAEHSYLITDRNLIPEILFTLSESSLQEGDIEYYRELLFRGLRFFHTNIEKRRMFIDQIRRTYRYTHRVLIDRRIMRTDKILFSLHWIHFLVQDRYLFRLTRLSTITRYFLLGAVYYLNYIKPRPLERSPAHFGDGFSRNDARPHRIDPRSSVHRASPSYSPILITRAMGGIGDFLMMMPALHAMKKRNINREIHLAIPRQYFSLFQNNDMRLIDIENEPFDRRSYGKWFNLSDCPASRVENRTAPRVRTNRIDIFAKALGLDWGTIRRMDHRPPYSVSEEERELRSAFWKYHGLEGKTVVGIQIRTEEVYRDYPHMEKLAHEISGHRKVLAFDAEIIPGYNGSNIIKVEGLPIRHAFALAAGCNLLIAPDSAFVHLAAALDIPCIAIYGPIDGKVRTRHYPNCKLIDARDRFGCLPCWRSRETPCRLTGMRGSVCLAAISVSEIEKVVNELSPIQGCG